MTEEWKKVYQGYLNADKNEVAEIARRKFSEIYDLVYKETSNEDTAFNFCIAAFASFVVMDDQLSNEEWSLFEYIMQQDLSRENVVNIMKCAENEELIKTINKCVDGNKPLKDALAVLGLCICAIDGNIAPDEHNLLLYYLD